jgi:hypothetical protein
LSPATSLRKAPLTIDRVFELLRRDYVNNSPIDRKNNNRLVEFICELHNRFEFKRRFDEQNDPDFRHYIIERCSLHAEAIRKVLGFGEALIGEYGRWDLPTFTAGIGTIGTGAALIGAAASTAAGTGGSAAVSAAAGAGVSLAGTATLAKATAAAALYYGVEITLAGGFLTALGLAIAGLKVLTKKGKLDEDEMYKHTNELTSILKNDKKQITKNKK